GFHHETLAGIVGQVIVPRGLEEVGKVIGQLKTYLHHRLLTSEYSPVTIPCCVASVKPQAHLLRRLTWIAKTIQPTLPSAWMVTMRTFTTKTGFFRCTL